MAPRRYVLRYQGGGAKPAGDVARIRQLPGVSVADESSRMLLVEGDEESLAGLAESLPGWAVAPEQSYSVPDTRRRLR